MKAIISGVYFLFDGKEIVYIGQSADIFRRIYEHSSGRSKGAKKHFDNWEYIEIEDEAERFRAEDFLILALRPKYNIDYSGANARCVKWKAETETQKENRENVHRIEHFLKEFDRITSSISVEDMDSLFGVQRGTFWKMCHDKTIPEDDRVHGLLSIVGYRIKFDAAYEMAQKYLRNKISGVQE